jgi:hypothetical protein
MVMFVTTSSGFAKVQKPDHSADRHQQEGAGHDGKFNPGG